MTYNKQIRKLAILMIKKYGIVKTSNIINISRTTLWRWKSKGVENKQRLFQSKLFNQVKDILKVYLETNICTDSRSILIFLKENHNINISVKTILKFIKKLGFTKKRIRTRGICKGNNNLLKTNFITTYKNAIKDNKNIISIDECYFSEKIHLLYGYAPKGKSPIIKINGSWMHYSLLMSVSSNGEKKYLIKKGSIKRTDFCEFIDSLQLDNNSCIIIDNASIHKKLTLNTNPVICYNIPYSPETNAIELCFGIIKNYFRKNNYSSLVSVPNLIEKSIKELNPKMILNSFRHVLNNYINF